MIISLLKTTPSKNPYVEDICQTLNSDAIRWFGSQPSFVTLEKEYGHDDYYINIYPHLPAHPVYPETVMDIVNTIETTNPELSVNYLHWGWRLGEGYETVRICLSDYKPPLWKDWGWNEEDKARATNPDRPLYKHISEILNSDKLDWAGVDKDVLINTEEGFPDLDIATIKIGKGYVSRAFFNSLLTTACKYSPTIAIVSCSFLGKLSNGLGWEGIDIMVVDEAQKILAFNGQIEEGDPDLEGDNINTKHPNLVMYREKTNLNTF